MKRPSLRHLAMGLLIALTMSSCTFQDIQLRADDRMRIIAPESREIVSAPVTVTWSMRDFTAVGLDGESVGDEGAFVVFVDRAPMPAGKTLEWLARDDTSCELDARCPDAQYLAERGIYVTTETSVTVPDLPRVGGVGKEQHYVNIVLVDGTGRRIGESAWYRQFQSERRSS